MNIIVDATNIRSGGGLTHLKAVLAHAHPQKYGIHRVIVFSNQKTLEQLPNFSWLEKKTDQLLNKSFIWSFYFQIFRISKLARKERGDLMFVPGGTFLGRFSKVVSMSRNMLPFEKEERRRYRDLSSKIRFRILKITQSYTFRHSTGVVFLSNYAKDYIVKAISLKSDYTIIPHGVNINFLNIPKVQLNIQEYSSENPFKLLYVSQIRVYKHHWNVAESVLRLRREGYPISLSFVGGATPELQERLNKILQADDEKIVTCYGEKGHEELHTIYKAADAFVFASSCENMPNILVEAMAAGLPIACSDRGPMPEVLGDAGLYFDPTDVQSIYECIKQVLENRLLRQQMAEKAYDKVQQYSWEICSEKTFKYLSYIGGAYQQ